MWREERGPQRVRRVQSDYSWICGSFPFRQWPIAIESGVGWRYHKESFTDSIESNDGYIDAATSHQNDIFLCNVSIPTKNEQQKRGIPVAEYRQRQSKLGSNKGMGIIHRTRTWGEYRESWPYSYSVWSCWSLRTPIHRESVQRKYFGEIDKECIFKW